MDTKSRSSRKVSANAVFSALAILLIGTTPQAFAKEKMNAVLALEDNIFVEKAPKLSGVIAPMIKTEVNKTKSVKIVDREPEAIAEAKRTGKKLDGAPYCLSGTLTLMPSYVSKGTTAQGDEKLDQKTGASLSVKFVQFGSAQILMMEEVSTIINGDVLAPSGKPEEKYSETPTGRALTQLAQELAKKLDTKLSASPPAKPKSTQ